MAVVCDLHITVDMDVASMALLSIANVADPEGSFADHPAEERLAMILGEARRALAQAKAASGGKSWRW